MARGIHEFALSIPYDLFVYNSRIGTSPSYSAIYRALQMLSVREADETRLLGEHLTKRGVLVIDNVQNYLRQRDSRIGRSNIMNIGLAGTYIELEDIDVRAFDMSAKSRILDENRQTTAKVEDFLDAIDKSHLDTVLTSHSTCSRCSRNTFQSSRHTRNTSPYSSAHEVPNFSFPIKSTRSQPAARTKQ